jgi:exopolyphosphatase/guanosine-5'-triphosphate,3'-diphosphate pyrophosphatase
MSIYAGIDIGTLTLRLLIARIDSDGSLHELAAKRRIARLGEGLQPSRQLQSAAMNRAVDTIRSWMPAIRESGAECVAAVATSAVRDALNRDDFLDQVKRETGLEVELLTGEEEARRTLLGIQVGLPEEIEKVLALDIGGGSTELIKVAGDSKPVLISIDEGVVRLTEDCLRNDPVLHEEVDHARQRIRQHLDRVASRLGVVAGYELVGTAGSITTLAAMDQRLEMYAPPRIHNYRLSFEAVRRLAGELLRGSRAERRKLPGLEPGREDLIVAGTLILQEVMQRFGFRECLVSDYGLREGVLIDLWQKNKVQ